MAKRQRIRRALILLSFLLFPITMYYFSPALIMQGAAEGVVAGSMLLFAAQFVTSLVLGRAFCGWVCPVGGLGECLQLANDRPVRPGRKDWIKFAIWAPWLGGIIALAASAGGLRRVEPLYMTVKGVSIAEPANYYMYYFVLAIVLALSLAMGRRAFCHTACWMAPFMILGTRLKRAGRWPSLHLRTQHERCIACRRCSAACTMSIDVQALVARGDMHHRECVLCGLCADNCPKDVLALKFGRPPARRVP